MLILTVLTESKWPGKELPITHQFSATMVTQYSQNQK